MSRQVYLELGFADPAGKAIDVVKKLGERATKEFIEILPKIQGFKFSMEDSCPIYEVMYKDKWRDLLFVLEELKPS